MTSDGTENNAIIIRHSKQNHNIAYYISEQNFAFVNSGISVLGVCIYTAYAGGEADLIFDRLPHTVISPLDRYVLHREKILSLMSASCLVFIFQSVMLISLALLRFPGFPKLLGLHDLLLTAMLGIGICTVELTECVWHEFFEFHDSIHKII